MSRQKQRTQKLYNSDNFQQFQDPLMITTKQPFEYDKLTTKSQKQFNLKSKVLVKKIQSCINMCLAIFNIVQILQKIWHENYMIFKDWSQELIGRFDSQFNYQFVVDKFYKECMIKINRQVVDQMPQYYHSVRNLLQKFNCSIIRSICRPYQFYLKIFFEKGYLLSGHSRFVINRINVRPNYTLNITNHKQTQMIILEYSYIQILLPLIVEGEFWKRMPNYKESLKIFVSILHNLFIESFQNLPSAQQDIIPDDVYFQLVKKNWVPLFDFSRNPIDGFYQLINCKHPKYSYNKDGVVLGLYNKVELHPIILHNGYKNIRDNFKQYCDYILSLIL